MTTEPRRGGTRLRRAGRTRPWLAAALTTAAIIAPNGTAGAADPPPNDLFADATPVSFGFAETIDTTMATTGEPEDPAAKVECGAPPYDPSTPPDATVWYTLTPPDTRQVQLSSAPPTYSAGFSVVIETGDGFECVHGGPFEVTFVAGAGQTYSIHVIDTQTDGGGNGGILNFSANVDGSPPSDVCPGIPLNSPFLRLGLNLIMGTDGDDELRGTPGDDIIFGLEGDDEINGRGGNDIIFGCAGADRIRGGAGDDEIYGDNLRSSSDPGGELAGGDELIGGSGNDIMYGGQGDDLMRGGQGADEMFGEHGNDEIRGGLDDDFAVGGDDDDRVFGNAGDDMVFGELGDDEVRGGSGDDDINGDIPDVTPDPNPNFHDCRGGIGTDTFRNCESERDR